jgi:hypothetical protein
MQIAGRPSGCHFSAVRGSARSFAAGVIAAIALATPSSARYALANLPLKLLEHAPPPPDWSAILDARIKAGLPLPPWPAPDTGPADSAEPAAHLAHWRQKWSRQDDQQPSPAAREKIVQAVLTAPTAIPEVLPVLPTTPEAAAAIAGLLEKFPANTAEDQEHRREIRAWVFRHGGLLRDEVIADARHAKWELYEWNERPDPTLDALQHRDPATATRLLQEFATGAEPGLAVVATRLLMEQAQPEAQEPWRKILLAAAAKTDTPETASKITIEALISAKWPEREAWILSTLSQPEPGNTNWYSQAIWQDADHWIPLLTKLVGGDNRHAHDHAVYLLAECWLRPRADALRPLLPWLMDPAWSKDTAWSRDKFIQSLDKVDLPECVAGLLQVVREEKESDTIAFAAQVLAHYQAKEAVAPLKAALAHFESLYFREMTEAIHQLGGFSPAEIVAALEAYFAVYPAAEDRRWLSPTHLDDKDPAVHTGHFFARSLPRTADLLAAIGKRATAVRKAKPALAAAFTELLVDACDAPARIALAQCLADGTLTDAPLAKALRHRRNPAWRGDEFTKMLELPGAAGGIAAVLAADRAAMAAILNGTDRQAQAALLAAARLTGDDLDPERVAALMKAKRKAVSRAAKAYLEDAESPAARRVWDQHQAKKQDPDDPLESYRLSISAQGGCGGWWQVSIYPDRAVATRNFDGESRIGTCDLTAAQVAAIRNYVTTYQVDELPPLNQTIYDGVEYNYVHTTRTGERQVFMDNPPTGQPSMEPSVTVPDPDHPHGYSEGIVIYAQLVNLFIDLFAQLDLKLSYGKNIDILVPREKATIKTVWKKGDDLRVFVENGSQRPNWQGVNPATGALTGNIAEPAGCGFLGAKATIHATEFNGTRGLWWCDRDRPPVMIAGGTFANPLVSPDGKWSVVAKAIGGNWAEPNTAVRINLETNEVLPIDLPPADNFDVVAFIPAHDRFLITRAQHSSSTASTKPVGPAEPEFHLLDPATGELERVTGTFSMLGRQTFRPLQATTATNQVWATDFFASSSSVTGTIVGRYDTQTFSFTPVRKIETVRFDAMDMWVDETAGMIYAAANGDLLRIPLRSD